jgi:mersacidin/lichenicidin family type 2 lantibiotic
MSRFNIVRAWKDAEYRRSLSEAERALLPDNPAGFIDLTDDDLDSIAGGLPPDTAPILCCPTMWDGCGHYTTWDGCG